MEHVEATPAVSVVIPMYNAARFIGEALDSLLLQTFADFEVIIVDDGSTDNSAAVVESYAAKFGGRLSFTRTEKNSGSGALPRNTGLRLARGKYVQFMDNDDTLTPTALEELHTLAEEHKADVVYCERYFMSTGVGQEFKDNVRPADSRIQKPPFVDAPTVETADLSERVSLLLNDRFWVVPWDKFVRRDLLVKHKIFFPSCEIADDDIWTYGLVIFAKKILRVPNAVYIRRMRDDSVTGTKRTPQQTITFWLNPVLFGVKALDKFMSRRVFFRRNPQQRFNVLEHFIRQRLSNAFRNAGQLSSAEVYATIQKAFGRRLGKYDVLIPALCTAVFAEKQARADAAEELRRFTARIDVKLMSAGGFEIVSVSDDKANVTQPAWLQKGGTGYVVTSYRGKLEFTARANVDGQVQLILRGLDIRDKADNSKRVPYWIDYTALTVNGQKVFDTLTPVWHNKPYRHDINVKGGEEFTAVIEWLPHRDLTTEG